MIYIGGGSFVLIVVPTVIFNKVEHWTVLESVYFCKINDFSTSLSNSAFISLSTIGFGDMVPMNDPPLEYATFKRDDEACFNELVDPIPSTDSAANGLPRTCSHVSLRD